MGKRFGNDDYQAVKTFSRVALTFAATFGGGAALVYGTPILDALPETFESWEQLATVLVTAAVPAAMRGMRNWAKNSPSAPEAFRRVFDARWGVAIGALLIPAFALGGCETTPFQREMTTTISYIDEAGRERTETVSTTEFDAEAFEAVMASAERLAELAETLRAPEASTPEEVERARQRYELERAALEALIEAARARRGGEE